MSNLVDKGQYLVNQGWEQKNQMVYLKQGIEIFFDNSNAIEIYRDGNDKLKLDDFYAQTVKNLIQLLVRIEEGKYE